MTPCLVVATEGTLHTAVELEVFQDPIVSKDVGVVMVVVVLVTERGCGQYKYFMYQGALRWVRADFSGNDIITTRQMEAAYREEARGPVESSTALSLGPRVTCNGTITFTGPESQQAPTSPHGLHTPPQA